MRNLRQWDIRLGLVQVVILLGLVTGSLVCSFYLGFFTGHDAGYEKAYAGAIASVPRIPIAAHNLTGDSKEEIITDVYAKLGDTGKMNAKKESAAPLPDLGAIKDSEAAPVVDAIKEPEESTKESDHTALAKKAIEEDAPVAVAKSENTAKEPVIKVLGEPRPSTHSGETLGSLLAGTESGDLKAPAAEEAKSAAVQLPAEPPKETKETHAAVVVAKEASAPAVVEKTSTEKRTVEKEKVAPPAKKKTETPPAKTSTDSAKVVKLAPAKESSLVKNTIPSGWFAQVAAPKSKAEAEGIAQNLKRSGFGVMIENAEVRGQQYFRVLVGPEESRDQADRMVGQLKRERSIKGEPFLRLVR